MSDMTEADRRRYIGYIRFMRGYVYYRLLMNYGPLLIVGDEALGAPESAEYYDRERSTYDESVDYICNEFKLATQGIYGPAGQSVSYSDRPTKGVALALIACLRLPQASPLFNGGDAAHLCFNNWKHKGGGTDYVNQTYDPSRWAVTAAVTEQVVNMEYCSLFTVTPDNQYPYPLADNVSTAPLPGGAGGIDPYHSFADMFNGEGIIQINKEFI